MGRPWRTLTSVQQATVDAISQHEHAVLVAPTGVGQDSDGTRRDRRAQGADSDLVDRTQLSTSGSRDWMEHLGLNRRQVGRVAATGEIGPIQDVFRSLVEDDPGPMFARCTPNTSPPTSRLVRRTVTPLTTTQGDPRRV